MLALRLSRVPCLCCPCIPLCVCMGFSGVEVARRWPWTRFWLDQSVRGPLPISRHCSLCHRRTRWAPEPCPAALSVVPCCPSPVLCGAVRADEILAAHKHLMETVPVPADIPVMLGVFEKVQTVWSCVCVLSSTPTPRSRVG
jgi:hypothetical protein